MNRNETELFTPAVPESLGISSSAILRFIERIEREGINMHGFLVLRKGRIAAEGYWAPFSRDRMHRMYSISKSFVSLAIGLLVDEGKLRLEDRVAAFFEDKVPDHLHPYVAQTTVRDLLMMAGPHSAVSYSRQDRDFADTFFRKEPSHPPGSVFFYDTAGTVVLTTIVERISGVPFLTYMRDKLLDPVGFSKEAWCIRTPEGTSWGGSGVMCTLRDTAKLAYVCMNDGRWNGKQLISEAYIREATSKQIDNSLSGDIGYGYQIWCEEDRGFSFRGMGSQFAIVYPDRELVFACTSDTQMMGHIAPILIRNALREELLANLHDGPLPADDAARKALERKIDSLHIIPQQGGLTSSYAEKINGKWYRLHENPMNISRLRFTFEGDEGRWEYENESGLHRLDFGIGKQKEGTFPETKYFGERIGTAKGEGYTCLVSGAWVEEHKLNLLVYITDDYLGTAKMTFSFIDDKISVHMLKAAEWFLDEYSGFAGGVLA
ncbi:serine hydrolase [Paenibacillus antri]|uniref:Serine hydrolase n=2 Tax=Paenibacillus antri TaxID=2582848 RepID=A0A5R9GF13_9BACL|nr:serine hydrolase [Paenibacillus antri]